MQYDQKRINGPESVPYQLNARRKTKSYDDKLADVFANNKRQDKRGFEEPRKIYLKLDVVSKAKGSAYIELGSTKVISSVYDPREIPKQNNFSSNGEIVCDVKFSPFAGKKRLSKSDVDEKSLALSLKRALQPAICRYAFPNFQVDIFVHVIEDDGAVLAAAINCAGAALADAGIPMYDIITASSLGIYDKNIVLDPTTAEEDVCSSVDLDQEHGIVVMSNLQTHEQVSELWLCGLMSGETVTKATDQLQKSNQNIVPIIKQLLVEKVKRNVEASEAEKVPSA